METNKKKLITHNGSFHADDIFACATLCLMLEKNGEEYEIIRTRDEKIIKTGDYVFDVGGVYDASLNRFDHHQVGGAGKHDNGIEYAAFGLVWKTYGKSLTESKDVALMIEKRVACPIDAFDNGISLVENKSDVVPYSLHDAFYAMRPTWREEDKSEDEMFLKCVDMAKEILKREIIIAQDALLAEEAVKNIYNHAEDKRIIVLDKNYPYEYTIHNFKEPLYVIHYSAVNDHWAAKAVRDDPKTFVNRKNFPKTWAGLMGEELQNITGVRDAMFCHRALFIAVAKSKEGAIKLAQIAVES